MSKTNKQDERPSWLREFYKPRDQVFTDVLNQQYLQTPGKRYAAYVDVVLHDLATPSEQKELYKTTVLLDRDAMQKLKDNPQKGIPWLKARKGCLTGSMMGCYANFNTYKSPLKAVCEFLFGQSDDSSMQNNPYIRYGNAQEPVARAKYEARIQQVVNKLYDRGPTSWRWNQDKTQPSIVFRGIPIPLKKANSTQQQEWERPVVQVLDTIGTMVDPDYKFLRLSPDGILFINGIALGGLEIKCSMNGVYCLGQLYHGAQVMMTSYIGRKHYPTMKWTDYMSFYAGDEYSIMTMWLDDEFCDNWVLPRLIKLYFEVMWPVLRDSTLYGKTEHGGIACCKAESVHETYKRPTKQRRQTQTNTNKTMYHKTRMEFDEATDNVDELDEAPSSETTIQPIRVAWFDKHPVTPRKSSSL